MWTRRPWLLAASATALTVGSLTKPSRFKDKENYQQKIAKASVLIQRYMVSQGIPGLSIGVSVDGRTVWKNGFGYANIELGSHCTGDTVMRIASISKPITATVAALLFQEGKIDLDQSVYTFLPNFPKKKFDGEEVDITPRQLFSHTGGIRHYEKKVKEGELETPDNKVGEYLLNNEFTTVSDALKMFQDDDLIAKPGTSFSYTTHGLTLASAILEKAAEKAFPRLVYNLCNRMELHNTTLDKNKRIINNRASYYVRTNGSGLLNCQEVNNSYKWAGGGLLSTVGDLLKFGNIIISSYQNLPNSLLKRQTIDEFWKGQIRVNDTTEAALGWMRIDGLLEPASPTIWYHTGGAVGASSVLLLRPTNSSENGSSLSGTCIVMLCNLQDVSLLKLAREIETIFRE